MKNKKVLVVIAIAVMLVTALSLVACAPSKITITFDTKGGSAIAAMEVENGGSFTFPANPTKEGFVLSGWYLDAAYTIPYASGKQKGDITLYAKWEPAPPVKMFTVTFDSQGGSAVEPIIIEEYNKIAALPKPTREGHDFQHWSRDKDGTSIWSELDNVGADMTLYAVWEKKLYHVTFDYYYNNQPGATITEYVKYGEKAPKVRDSLLNDSIMVGWYKEPACNNEWNFDEDVVKADMTLYAKWKDKEVKAVELDETHGNIAQKLFLINDTFSYVGLQIKVIYVDDCYTSVDFTGEVNDPALKKFTVAKPSGMDTAKTLPVTIMHILSGKYCRYNITIHDPIALKPNDLFIKTMPKKLDFYIGEKVTESSSEGLVVEKTSDLFGSRRIKMDKTEYLVDGGLVEIATTESVCRMLIREIPKMHGESVLEIYYEVNVVDISAQTVTEIRVRNLPQQEFYTGEPFNASGIVVEKVMSGGKVFDMPNTEYRLDKSAFDNTRLGDVDIVITLIADVTKTVSYKVSVIQPKYIGVYYIEENARLSRVMEIKADGKCYDYDEMTGKPGAVAQDIVINGRDKGKVLLNIGGTDYAFDPILGEIAGVFVGVNVTKYRIKENQIVLELNIPSPYICMLLVDDRGRIPQKYIDGLAAFGSLYLTNDRTQLITAETIFDKAAQVYVFHNIRNYQGLPFLGKYIDPFGTISMEIIYDGSMIVEGVVFAYSAEEDSAGVWTLRMPMMDNIPVVYDATAKTLSYGAGAEQISQTQLTADYAIVTLTAAPGAMSDVCVGEYAVKKGEAINLDNFTFWGDTYKITLIGYTAGTIISADCTFVIESAVLVQP